MSPNLRRGSRHAIPPRDSWRARTPNDGSRMGTRNPFGRDMLRRVHCELRAAATKRRPIVRFMGSHLGRPATIRDLEPLWRSGTLASAGDVVSEHQLAATNRRFTGNRKLASLPELSSGLACEPMAITMRGLIPVNR